MSRGKPVTIPGWAHKTPVLIYPTQWGCIFTGRKGSSVPSPTGPLLSLSEAFSR